MDITTVFSPEVMVKDMIKITQQMMKDTATIKGGHTRKQIDLAMNYCKENLGTAKWKQPLIGTEVPDKFWKDFQAAASKKKKKLPAKAKIINSVSKNTGDWEWQPGTEDIPAPKFSKKAKKTGKKKANRARVTKLDSKDFYLSREWRELRVRVLEKYECKCMMCGRSPKDHGIVIHIDHIKPRSKWPDLSLNINNLQILCEDCNLGKSNKYQTDWRPDDTEKLDEELLSELPVNF